MADYNHRRVVSEVETYHQSLTPGALYSHRQAGLSRHSPVTRTITVTSSKTMNAHLRSQSHESPCSYTLLGRDSASALAVKRSRYGDLLSTETAAVYPRHMRLSQLDSQRRGSESSTSSDSTSSAVSNCTAVARDSWSATTTPEALSPISPSNSLLLHSPKSRPTFETTGLSSFPPASPLKSECQASTSCRSSWSHACLQSAPRRLPSSLFEPSLVSDEDEQVELTHSITRGHGKTASHQEKTLGESSIAGISSPLRTAKSVSNLRQRRQQKVGVVPQAKQPTRLRLSPLPPLPKDQQSGRRLSTVSPRTLTPSRSMPHIRDTAGPPPTGPLPPLPNLPITTSSTPMTPSSPSFSSHMYYRSPYSPGPPAMPSRPPPASPSLAVSPMNNHKPSEQQSLPWEEELRRHKKLLQQFPSEPEECKGLPKLSRTHRSLGNIRARSRSLSRATGTHLHGDAEISESRLSHQTSSFSLRGLKMQQRSSTAKSARGTPACCENAPITNSGMPYISIFEDDSEEEGDAVRKFVRNLFTRRSRSAEVPAVNQPTLEQAHEVSSSSRHVATSSRSFDGTSRGNRTDNGRASSASSPATSVGAGMMSTASTLSADDLKSKFESESRSKRGQPPSSMAFSDQSRQHQKGPLLSRMFVRWSH